MREKNKNILKALGVGALACVGMVGLTGCSVGVSQSQIDNLIETVEQQANKMTKEEAWNFAQTADFNLMMNVNGARDNLSINVATLDGSMSIENAMMYYNSDSVKVFTENFDGTSVELWYQTETSNVVLASIKPAGTGYMCDLLEERDENAVFENSVNIYRGTLPTINSLDLTYEDLNHYEILENGNVKLTFVQYVTDYQDEEETEYVQTLEVKSFEYSSEGKLIALERISKMIDKTENAEVSELEFGAKYTLVYGALDTELLETWVAIAEAKRNAQ